MIRTFGDQGTVDIFDGKDTRQARKTCPAAIWSVARRKLFMIHQAAVLQDLRSPPGNQLEALKGNRKGQHGIRINKQYRVCFVWTEQGAENVEITDYH